MFKCQISFKKKSWVSSHAGPTVVETLCYAKCQMFLSSAGGFDLPILSTQQGLEERLKVHRDETSEAGKSGARGVFVRKWMNILGLSAFLSCLAALMFPSPRSESARLGSLQTLFTTPSCVNWTVGLCGWAAHTWDKTSPSHEQLRSIFLL